MNDSDPDIKPRTSLPAVLATENKVFWRGFILALLIVSMLGPWAYDKISVPAEYPCEWPVVRLYGDFCGMPFSWFSGFLLFAGDLFHILRAVVTGTFTGRGRELFVLVLLILPILPFFSTLLLLWKKDLPTLRKVHLIAWGLGCIFPLFILFVERNVRFSILWGPWLYLLVAVSAVIFEILICRTEREAENGAEIPFLI